MSGQLVPLYTHTPFTQSRAARAMAAPEALQIHQTQVFRALHDFPEGRVAPCDVARRILGVPGSEALRNVAYKKVWRALERLVDSDFAECVGGLYTALGAPEDEVDGRRLRLKGALRRFAFESIRNSPPGAFGVCNCRLKSLSWASGGTSRLF